MIEIQNLVKRYGAKYALNDISFTVEKGEVVGFLGPNGAGKTTTMNILTGYISSTSGSAKVDGFDILEHPYEVKKRIGYLPENPPLYFDMTVDEYLSFVYDLKKVKKKDKKAHLDRIKNIVKIKDVEKRRIGNLSKGYKQRVGLAQALIGDPEVLILDEPTVGLDPAQIIEIRNLIRELGKERTIILSTHILPEVSAICERVLIINQGKIIASDTTEHLISTYSSDQDFLLKVEGERSKVQSLLSSIDGVRSVQFLRDYEDGTTEFKVSLTSAELRKDLIRKLSEADISVLTAKNVELSLEDIFVKLTSSSGLAVQDMAQEETDEAAQPEDEEGENASSAEEEGE